MLALHLYRESLCPGGCGQKLADGISHERDGIEFVCPPPVRCRACDALAMAQEADERLRPHTLLWSVKRKR